LTFSRKEAMLREDEDFPETDQEERKRSNELEYREVWNDGYSAIRDNKEPPDLLRTDRSPYAQGVREGATAALDEREAWARKWIDPLLFLLGSHPSQILGKNLEKAGDTRPSSDHDAHHIVAWRHWRAGPGQRILEKYDIPINGVENGVWVPRRYNKALTSHAAIDAVNEMLRNATNRPEALKILKKIKYLTSIGKFPPP